MDTTLLTQEQRVAIKSMVMYWREVDKRDDISPLYRELSRVVSRIGVSILFILAEYAEACDAASDKEDDK